MNIEQQISQLIDNCNNAGVAITVTAKLSDGVVNSCTGNGVDLLSLQAIASEGLFERMSEDLSHTELIALKLMIIKVISNDMQDIIDNKDFLSPTGVMQ